MFEYYFYESNRDIVTENVVKCYSMISKYGFQPSMGKIKMVEGDDLKGEKLYKVSVIPKRNDKPLSITNFMVETEEVTNEEERKKLQEEIKNTEKTIDAMKLARKSLFKFKSAFEEGLNKA